MKRKLTDIKSPPVIICGMHRSGTTLVTKVLQQMGLFVGNDLEVNSESLKFMFLNDELLSYTHSFWDQIRGCFSFFNNKEAVANAVEIAKEAISQQSFVKDFVGKNKIRKIDNWGWKDPRNTLMFPIWEKVFPGAKFIFIYRNGIDSANSLVTREHNQDFDITIPAYSSRNLNIEGSFSLWEDYNRFFFEYKHNIAPENLYELRYEDFLLNANKYIKEMCEYVNIDATFSDIDNAGKIIKKERAYSFVGNTDLEEFYSSVKDSAEMKRLGYSDLC